MLETTADAVHGPEAIHPSVAYGAGEWWAVQGLNL